MPNVFIHATLVVVVAYIYITHIYMMMVLLWGGGPVMECQSEIYPTSKLLPKGRVDFRLFQGFLLFGQTS